MATLTSFVLKYSMILKYLISGGSAAVVNLSVLYIVTDMLHVWYLLSSVIANVTAFFVSFFLQKFWTFSNATVGMMKKQLVLYIVVAAMNLGINTLFMYLFVEDFHLHYLIAQIATSALIAVESYFVYQHLIFKRTDSRSTT